MAHNTKFLTGSVRIALVFANAPPIRSQYGGMDSRISSRIDCPFECDICMHRRCTSRAESIATPQFLASTGIRDFLGKRSEILAGN